MLRREEKKLTKKIVKVLKKCLIGFMTAAAVSGISAQARYYNLNEPAVIKNGDSAVVSAELTDIRDMAGSVMLIVAAQDKITGKISNISVDTKELTGDTVSLSATVRAGAGDEIKYYITDEKGGSLLNLKPSGIKGFRVVPKLTSVGVEWLPASDDSGEVEYIVYKDGTEYARTSDTSVKYRDVSGTEEYSFSVEAVDKHGLSGGRSEIASGGLYKESYIDFDKSENKGVVFKAITDGNKDGYAVRDEIGGCACYRTARPGEEGYNKTYSSFLYFTADRNNVDENVSRVAVVFDYYDDTTGAVSIQYNAADGTPGKSASAASLTGTMKWKRGVVILEDAKFVAATNLSNSDFRLGGGYNGKLYIKRVAVMPADNYDEEEKTNIFIASDSIAANWTSTKNVGWGMKFGKYLNDDKAKLYNYAVAGSSTKTFPNWNLILSQAKAGDYVILCFGHNDSMTDSRGVTVEEFKSNLKYYADEIRIRGAVPIILTSIPQYNSEANTMLYNTGENLMNYRNASLELASEMGIASYDAGKAMYDTFMEYYAVSPTQTHTKYLGMYNDEGWANRTHVTDSGAELLANLIANGIYNNAELPGLKELMTVFVLPKDEFTPEEPETPDTPTDDTDDGRVRIYVMGDSVAKDYESGSVVGWGTKLAEYVNTEIAKLVNLSDSGVTTQNNAGWEAAKSKLNAGDFVIIALGYEDSVAEIAVDSYKAKLIEYIAEIKEAEATPIVITALPQYDSSAKNVVYNQGEDLMAYRTAAVEAAEETEIISYDAAKTIFDDFWDMAFSTSVSKANTAFIKRFVKGSSNNRVYLTEEGAEYVSELIINAFKSNEKLSGLTSHLLSK